MDLPMNQDKLKTLIASIPTDQLKSDEIEPLIQQMRKHLIEQLYRAKWTPILAMTDMSVIVAPIAEMAQARRR